MNIQDYGVMNLSWASCIYATDLGIECVKHNYIKSTKTLQVQLIFQGYNSVTQ